MIILTAQQVRSAMKQVGINTYLYEHPGSAPKHEGLVDPMAAMSRKLQLSDWDIEIHPGRNDVVAFLDFVLDEGAGSDEIDTATRLIQNLVRRPNSSLAAQPVASVRRLEGGVGGGMANVGVRFNVEPALIRHAEALVGVLGKHCSDLLRGRGPGTRVERVPLVVTVEIVDGMYKYTLSPESAARIRQGTGQAYPPPRVSLELGGPLNLPSLPWESELGIATILSGLSDSELIGMGGVKFISASDGSVLGEWPRETPPPRHG